MQAVFSAETRRDKGGETRGRFSCLHVQNGNFVSVVLANNRRNINVVQFVEPINLNPNSFEF